MKQYTQLTQVERSQIYALLKEGFTPKEIAKNLGRSASTISREINRNSGERGYRFKQAQTLADERRSQASSRPTVSSGSDFLIVKTWEWTQPR